MTEITPVADLTELGGKYLTFFLEQEEYGLEILKVREIIGHSESLSSTQHSFDYVQPAVYRR